MKGLTITRKDGDVVIIIDNEVITIRLQFNPWTLKVTNEDYCIKK